MNQQLPPLIATEWEKKERKTHEEREQFSFAAASLLSRAPWVAVGDEEPGLVERKEKKLDEGPRQL